MKLSTMFNAYASAHYRYDVLYLKMSEAENKGEDDKTIDALYEQWHKLIRKQSTFRYAISRRIKEIENGAR